MSWPTYISNPTLWGQFQHTDDGENFIPMIRRKVQRGGGILNRRRAYIIPVRLTSIPKPDIQQVSQVAAEKERVVSELKESMRNDEPHMPLKKSIKSRKKRAPARRSSNTKGKGRSKKKKEAKATEGWFIKKEDKEKEESEIKEENYWQQKDHSQRKTYFLKRKKNNKNKTCLTWVN